MFEFKAKGRMYNTGTQLLIVNGLNFHLTKQTFRYPIALTVQFLSRFNLSARVLRLKYDAILELKCGDKVVFFKRTLYKINSKNEVKKFTLKHKILGACTDGVNVYFGDYFGNPNREEVSLRRLLDDNIEVLWTFLPGEVRHIHNVIPYKEFLLIMTGDYGHECGLFMYNSQSDFICVVAHGGQLSRFVTGIVKGDTLITATDTHITQNYTVTLDLAKGTTNLGIRLPGPVFDIVHDGERFYLTTVVEFSDYNSSDFVELYSSTNGIKWELEASWKKDLYPKRLHKYTQFNRVSLCSLNGEVYLSFLGIKNMSNKIYRLCR